VTTTPPEPGIKTDVLIAIGIGTAAVVIGVAIAVVVNLGSKKRK
jgi:hypothetical protein